MAFIRIIILMFLLGLLSFEPLGADPIDSLYFHLPVNKRVSHLPLIYPRYADIRPVVGLSLSGGGARGIAHIGVLKVLSKNQIPIDYVVGTSMGSIIGGLFASGYTPDELWQIARKIRWNEIIQDQPPRSSLFLSQKEVREPQFIGFRFNKLKPQIPPAVSPGQKLYSVLSQYILRAPYQVLDSFDDLKIPFRSIATDLISGRKVYFDQGDLARVMMASSAIPLLFSPVRIDSFLLMDGGILDNIPVEYLKEKKVDLIIAVDATSPLRNEKNIRLPWQLADQVTTIMQTRQKDLSRRAADVVITPRLLNRFNTDFDSLETAYLAGMEAAQQSIAKIKRLLDQKAGSLVGKDDHLFTIDSVIVNGAQNAVTIPNLNNLPLHISANQILQLLQRIYHYGIFESVSARIIPQDSLRYLEISTKPYPILEKISFVGNHYLSDSLLNSVIVNKVGNRFNVFQWQWDRERLLRLFRDKDLSKAIVSREELNHDTGELIVHINEGRIGSIVLTGNKKTRDFVILREYPLKPGDLLRTSLAEKGVQHIYSLGFFERVQAEYVWKKEKIQAKIHLVEKPSTLFQFNYAFDRDDRLQTQFKLTEENLFGLGNRFFITSIVGKRRYEARAQLLADRWLNTYITTSMEGFYFKRKHYVFTEGNIRGEYQERRSGFHFSVGKQLQRIGRLSLRFGVEQISLAPVFGDGYPITETNQTSLRLQSIVDSRDKVPFPNSGRYHNFYYEITNELFSKKVPFSRVYSSFESYYTFFGRLTFHPRLLWATADLTTPFQEMFVLGESDSFWGYRKDERRGRRFFFTSANMRYFVPSRLPISSYFLLGIQFGQIWQNSLAEFNLSDFVYGYGGGISIKWLAGVFSFRYGVNSDHRKEYYFHLGFHF